MEFTKEQQEYIDGLIVEKTKGLFTEDDLNKKVTSEVDRRVETGIQKGLETHKQKWQKEFEDNAKLTAEELARKQLESLSAEINTKELEISKRSNHLEARELLGNAGVPKQYYEKFIDIMVTEDSENTKVNVENFIANFNDVKMSLESDLKSQLSKIPSPSLGDNKTTLTKEEFKKMTYNELMELKKSNPELYSQMIK